MIVILPETKGITLERMEKIFGGVDFVEAGENELNTTKKEESTIHHALVEGPFDVKAGGAETSHVEEVYKES